MPAGPVQLPSGYVVRFDASDALPLLARCAGAPHWEETAPPSAHSKTLRMKRKGDIDPT